MIRNSCKRLNILLILCLTTISMAQDVSVGTALINVNRIFAGELHAQTQSIVDCRRAQGVALKECIVIALAIHHRDHA